MRNVYHIKVAILNVIKNFIKPNPNLLHEIGYYILKFIKEAKTSYDMD